MITIKGQITVIGIIAILIIAATVVLLYGGTNVGLAGKTPWKVEESSSICNNLDAFKKGDITCSLKPPGQGWDVNVCTKCMRDKDGTGSNAVERTDKEKCECCFKSNSDDGKRIDICKFSTRTDK